MKEENIKERYREKQFGIVNVRPECEYKKTGKLDSWGSEEFDYGTVVSVEWQIELPHSCDEWVIGSTKNAKEFLHNLTEAIKYCEENPIVL